MVSEETYNQSEGLKMMSSRESLKAQESKIAFVYAERLMNGQKHFEFRRSAISFDLTHMIVYASSPVKKILGIVKVNRVCIANPNETWEGTKDFAGINQQDFHTYFSDKDIAYSIEIEPESTIRLDNQFSPKEIDPEFQVPQSFRYVDNRFLKQVLKFGTR
jgi:predicted transcriptional regulator